MCTGDNIYTAIAVGRKTNLINVNSDVCIVDLKIIDGSEKIIVDVINNLE